MTKITLVTFFLLLLIQQGCDGGGLSNPSAFSLIPSVDFQCDQDQVPQCSSAQSQGKTFYLGLHTSTDSCDIILASLGNSPFRLGFDAYGQGVTDHIGFSATGNINTWKSSSNVSIQYIDSGTYNVCGFIDLNNNGRIDNLEPIGSGTMSTSMDPNPAINSWTAY